MKATIEEVQLYLLPQRIPMIEIPAGATIVARKAENGMTAPIIVNIATMVDTNAVSTIALVFVCFINLHSTYKKID